MTFTYFPQGLVDGWGGRYPKHLVPYFINFALLTTMYIKTAMGALLRILYIEYLSMQAYEVN